MIGAVNTVEAQRQRQVQITARTQLLAHAQESQAAPTSAWSKWWPAVAAVGAVVVAGAVVMAVRARRRRR